MAEQDSGKLPNVLVEKLLRLSAYSPERLSEEEIKTLAKASHLEAEELISWHSKLAAEAEEFSEGFGIIDIGPT